MTDQLMNLADGKLVLVLEGGYELNALASCAKACVETLLGRHVCRRITCCIHFDEYFLD
jgi:acetoin utilization deacetylase AcuC-like enzyme